MKSVEPTQLTGHTVVQLYTCETLHLAKQAIVGMSSNSNVSSNAVQAAAAMELKADSMLEPDFASNQRCSV